MYIGCRRNTLGWEKFSTLKKKKKAKATLGFPNKYNKFET
jgi:hypothetical protein